jgi:hypothetical protein
MGCPPSNTATQLLVVPKSIPMTFPIASSGERLQNFESDMFEPDTPEANRIESDRTASDATIPSSYLQLRIFRSFLKFNQHNKK